MTPHFDALDYAQQLETAGVPKAQAEVHARTLAHVVNECVAVPADLVSMQRELTHQISETETRLRAEIQAVEARLTIKLERMEAQLRGEIASLRGEIASLRDEMKFHRWANGLTIALIVGIYVQLLFR